MLLCVRTEPEKELLLREALKEVETEKSVLSISVDCGWFMLVAVSSLSGIHLGHYGSLLVTTYYFM